MKKGFFGFLSILFLCFPLFSFAQVPETVPMPEGYEFFEEAEIQSPVQSESIRGRITEIHSLEEMDGLWQAVFTVVSPEGEEFTIDTNEALVEGLRYRLREGQQVYLEVLRSEEGVQDAFLVDVYRVNSMLWIALLFAGIILAIGRWRGLAALFGLAVTLVILFAFVLPEILSGSDPVLVTVIGSIAILAVNMHLSHGFSRNTLYAFFSTAVGLGIVLVLSKWFVWLTNLSGLSSEESILLYFHSDHIIVPSGILLAGIILGAVGVLDDIAITQSETVQELRRADPELTRKELFKRTMSIGRHHIASTVNTLVLAYAGVALPLFLLFLWTPGIDTIRFINEEPVAEEIVRTLAGTIALVLTVPISTLFATFSQKE